MGRLSQAFWFINREKIPTEREMKFIYSHISKTEELKKIRKDVRAEERVEGI